MTFSNPFAPSTDPKYVRFREGIDSWVLGKPPALELRWSPWEAGGSWRRYSRTTFTHVDFGEPPGPTSPLELRWNWGGNYTYESHVTDFDWPRIFTEVEKRYSRFAYAHPRAVWNIYDGSWRTVIGGGETNPGPGNQKELEEKIAEVKDLEARRIITNEQAQRRIDQLLQEYI